MARRPARAAAPLSDDASAAADRLHSAAIHLLRRLRKVDDASGLSAPRLSALSVVVFGGPLTLGALAAAEQVRPPTMTRLARALEAAGLVTLTPDEADRRVTLVAATARGRRVLAEGRTRRVALLTERVAELAPEDRAVLARAAELMESLSRAE
ncbi:MAG: MarR family winged helix-turn-helix transcriptional regulator [Gemmatimonadaceae bacterium]